jgi:non-ribosomal peptide synthetase component E (peptide arylation enzyme)
VLCTSLTLTLTYLSAGSDQEHHLVEVPLVRTRECVEAVAAFAEDALRPTKAMYSEADAEVRKMQETLDGIEALAEEFKELLKKETLAQHGSTKLLSLVKISLDGRFDIVWEWDSAQVCTRTHALARARSDLHGIIRCKLGLSH